MPPYVRIPLVLDDVAVKICCSIESCVVQIQSLVHAYVLMLRSVSDQTTLDSSLLHADIYTCIVRIGGIDQTW